MPRVYVPANLPHDAVLLSSEKWAAIGAHLTREQEQEARRRRVREAAETRKAKSKQMQNDWPNTLAKLHAKRLLEREERLRKKEEDQLKIDAEEAEIQARLRKEKLDAAREMLFHEEERVRNLDSALLLSEVLKERDEQVKLHARLKSEEEQRERLWFQHLQWDWMKQAEVEEAEAARRKHEKQRSSEKEFADNIRLKAEAMKHELQADEQVRKATEEYNRLMEEDKVREHEKKLHFKKETDKLLRTQRAFELLKTKRDEEENAEIRVYGLGKLEMAKGINKQKAELLDKSRRRSEAACAQLEKMMNAKQEDEDARIAAVVAQKQAERDAREAATAAARAAAVAAINRHRLQDIAQKEAAARQAAEDTREHRRRDHRRIELMAAELRERQQDLIDQRARNRRDWLDQMEETEAKRLVEKEEDYAEVRGLKCTVKKEQQKFDEYVRAEMERLKKNGRNTFPLKVAAKASAPGFLRHSTDWSGVGIRPY